MWVLMSAAEREEFLAGVHIGVLSAAGTAGRTLAVPVWYSYQPGGLLTVLTGRRSRKAAAVRAAGRFSLCVQDERPPYRYVSVEGPVVSEEELDPAERLAMARRYLGAAGGDRYVADNPDPGRNNVAFRMRPERWRGNYARFKCRVRTCRSLVLVCRPPRGGGLPAWLAYGRRWPGPVRHAGALLQVSAFSMALLLVRRLDLDRPGWPEVMR
jgi:PPOX class probable F420-dependent enzyme